MTLKEDKNHIVQLFVCLSICTFIYIVHLISLDSNEQMNRTSVKLETSLN